MLNLVLSMRGGFSGSKPKAREDSQVAALSLSAGDCFRQYSVFREASSTQNPHQKFYSEGKLLQIRSFADLSSVSVALLRISSISL